jgi:hypothetical protein
MGSFNQKTKIVYTASYRELIKVIENLHFDLYEIISVTQLREFKINSDLTEETTDWLIIYRKYQG